MYEWVNDSTELSLIGAGPAHGVSWIHSPSSNPGRFWTSGDNRVELVDWDPIDGGEDINFRVRGSGTGLTVKFYRNAEEEGGEKAMVQVNLSGSLSVTGGASSASRSGNNIIDVDADDGSRLYTVARSAIADSVTTGDKEVWFATAE
jgi:hypothetical protein